MNHFTLNYCDPSILTILNTIILGPTLPLTPFRTGGIRDSWTVKEGDREITIQIRTPYGFVDMNSLGNYPTGRMGVFCTLYTIPLNRGLLAR